METGSLLSFSYRGLAEEPVKTPPDGISMGARKSQALEVAVWRIRLPDDSYAPSMLR